MTRLIVPSHPTIDSDDITCDPWGKSDAVRMLAGPGPLRRSQLLGRFFVFAKLSRFLCKVAHTWYPEPREVPGFYSEKAFSQHSDRQTLNMALRSSLCIAQRSL